MLTPRHLYSIPLAEAKLCLAAEKWPRRVQPCSQKRRGGGNRRGTRPRVEIEEMGRVNAGERKEERERKRENGI